MSKINSKNKGQAFEYEIRDTLKKLDPKVRRSIMSGALKNIFDSDQSDIATSLPIAVECKRTEKVNIYKFYEQAKTENKDKTKMPVVAVRSNRKEALAVLSWEDFIRLLKFSLSGGYMGKEKISKPKKPKKLSSQETSKLRFSKEWSARRASRKKAKKSRF